MSTHAEIIEKLKGKPKCAGLLFNNPSSIPLKLTERKIILGNRVNFEPEIKGLKV